MKNRNKFLTKTLSLLTLVVMGFGAMSFTKTNQASVYASAITETSVAKIGEDGYQSLEDAIEDVNDDETIVILKNIDSDTPIVINSGKTFTIDFKDGSTQHYFRWFDMMGSQTDKDIFTIDDNSNVTVKNMQYKIGVGEKANRVFNVNSTATLTLTNMICSNDDDIKDIPVRNNGGTVIIDGGDITTYAPGGANLLSPVVQNLNNGTTTITGNGTFTMKNNSTGVAWLGNIVTMASSSTDADQENPCGTVIIENGTFNGGHIVDVNGKGTVIINDGTLTTGIGPAIKTFHGGVKSKITVNNITTSTMAFSQVLEELNTKIDFQNGNVKSNYFCFANNVTQPMHSVSIKNGKFGPKSGTTDIRDVIEGFLAEGAVISALIDDPDGYTYKVETVTPADILPADLLASFNNKWDNENGYSMLYVHNGKIWLHDISSPTTFINDVSITTPLTKNGDNYLTICNGITYTFSMENGVLTSISVSGATSRFNGTYRAPHTHSYGDVSASWNDNQVTLTTECSCGDIQTQKFTGNYTKVSDATCTAKETGKYVVIVDEGIFAGTYESEVFEKGELSNHHTTKVDGQSATCTDDGYKDAYYCEGCEQYFEDEEGQTLIGDSTAYNTWKSNTGKLPASGHHTTKVDGQSATCTDDGYKDAYYCEGCEQYFEDEEGQTLIGDSTAYNTWKLNTGKLPASGHHTTKVDGQSATCTEDGYKDAYYCEGCEQYFEDEEGQTLIGDSTAYNTWKLNTGKLPASGHHTTKVDGQSPTCSEDGYKDAYYCEGCEQYFEDEEGQTLIGDETAYNIWKLNDGKVAANGHHTTKVDGQSPTCSDDGYKDAYYCEECGMYFENADGTGLIGDQSAYNTWKLNGGKISKTGHHTTLVNGQSATSTEDGYKDAYYCEECGMYFENADGTGLIGGQSAYNAWKINDGFLPRLLSTGALVGICVGSFFLLLLLIYVLGYFFLYRKGKLDEKKIKVIYKILPRGEYSLKEYKK